MELFYIYAVPLVRTGVSIDLRVTCRRDDVFGGQARTLLSAGDAGVAAV